MSGQTSARVGATLLSVGLIAVMLGAALVPWWPVYASPAFVTAAAVATASGLTVGALAVWRGWPGWLVLAATGGLFLVIGVPAAVPTQALGGILPTPVGEIQLVAALGLGWKQLVTVAAPVGSYQGLLVPVFASTLAAAVGSSWIALRTRHPAAAALPPAALLVLGIAFGVVRDDLAAPAGIAFLAAAAAWLVRVAARGAAGRHERVRVDARRVAGDARRIAGAAALVVVAIFAAAATAGAVPPDVRDVLRSRLQPPFEPSAHDSPLAAFRNAFAPDEKDRPQLEVRGLPAATGLRLATLDTYDGVVYTVGGGDGAAASGTFSRVPYRLDRAGAPGRHVSLEVDVDGYRGVWVPGVGSLERIAFTGPRADLLNASYFYNDATGTGAVTVGLQRGDGLTADSVAITPAADLVAMRPGTAVLPASPQPPAELERLIDRWSTPSDPPGVRLAAVIGGFRSEGYVSHGQAGERQSRSGHSLDRIAELASAQPMIGDGEQYAVAAALAARRLGFPARVVVGYLREGAAAGAPATSPAAGGSTVFDGGDLQAWIEVQTADGAWRSIDPNPAPRPIPAPQPQQPTVISRPQSALPPPDPHTPIDDLAPDPDQSHRLPDDQAAAWIGVLFGVLRITGLVLAILAVLVSPFLAIVSAKLRRRRIRRRAPDRAGRVEGGWQEFADTAADYGYPVAAGATRAEQAAAVGGLDALVLASVVDRALFAPGGPGDGDDDRVWRAVDGIGARLAASRSRRDRVRAAISLTSLGYAGWRRGGRS